MVYRLLRPVISLALLAGSLWFAFSVDLGPRTFAEHIDRIGQTPEAHELIEGTRATVNPMLQEATERMLGEHIEAPIRSPEPTQGQTQTQKTPVEPAGSTHAATATADPRRRTSGPDHPRLPGRR